MKNRDIERVMKLRLLDDVFMKAVLHDNISAVQLIVRIILNRQDIEVVDVKTQEELTSLFGHSVRLDVLARAADGKRINLEIQRSDRGAEPKRARYHLSAVDWHTLPAGADYSELPETYILFITENDLYGQGLPVYEVDRFIRQTGEAFEDEEHIIYVNGAYTGEDDIGKLMSDFRATDPGKIHYEELAEKIKMFKQTEGGLSTMCKIMEEVRQEGVLQGMQQGIQQGMQQGIEKGICASVKLMRDVPYSRELVIQKIMEQFQLAPQVAEEKVAQYWPQ